MDEKNEAEESATNIDWYKKWWGVLLMVIFWYVLVPWYIWTKATWPKSTKVVITGLMAIVILGAIATSATEEEPHLGSDTKAEQSSESSGSGSGDVGTQDATQGTRSTSTPVSTTTTSPEPVVITLAGSGQEASKKFNLSSGLSIFKMTHNGKGHFGIWLLDNEGDNVELLVSETGVFDGSKAVGVDAGEYLLDVDASGGWTVTIEQPRP